MKILKRLFKIFVYAASVFLVLVLLIGGLTQTKIFKDRLRTFLADEISTQLNGSLTMGALEGNFFTGFTIDSLTILHSADTIIAAKRIILRYEPLSLLKKSREIKDLIIDEPSIFIKRAQGKDWNIGRLFKPSTSPDTSRPDWTLTVHNLEIHHGTVRLVDSASLSAADHDGLPEPFVEYHHFELHDVNLALNASLSDQDYRAHILGASFYSMHPVFQVTQFKAELIADRHHLSARNMILQTGDSYVELDAQMKGLNVFNGISLPQMEHDSTQFHLRTNAISFAELKQFLPQLGFLAGSAFLDCEASGEFGHLFVQRMTLKTYNSDLRLTGSIRNLHQPDHLSLSIVVNAGRINPADLSVLLPPFSLPSFEHVGNAELHAEFEGAPQEFSVKTTLRGGFGSLHCEGSLNLRQSVPSYHLAFETSDLTVESFTGSAHLRTRLRASGEIHGEGFSLQNLNDSLTLRVDSSLVQHLAIDRGSLRVRARGRQIDLSTDVDAREMNASVHATCDLSDSATPRYRGDITLGSFDLSSIFLDDAYRSSLTLRSKISGSGTSIDDISGTASVSLLSSTFQGRTLKPQEVTLQLDQHEHLNKRLSLESSFADAELRGLFDLDLAAAALVRQTSRLLSAIEEHALPPDTSGRKKKTDALRVAPHSESQRKLNFTYALSVNDLEPIALFTGVTPYNAHGHLEGTISGTDELLSITGKGKIDELFIGSVNNGVFMTDTKFELATGNLSPDQPLERLTARCSLSVGSALINNFKCDNFDLALDYRQLTGTFSLSGTVDSLYDVRAIGQASIQPHTYAFDFDTLNVSIGNYAWVNDQDVQVRLNNDGVRILHADMRRRREMLSVSGILHHTGDLDLTAAVRGYRLEGMNVFFAETDEARAPGRFRGIAAADLHLSGSLESPLLTFSASTESTYYKQTPVGFVRTSINYSGQLATIDASVRGHTDDPQPSLLIKGTLPVNLSFKGVDERFPDADQHLQISSDGFDVSVLEPLLMDFESIRGKVRCDINLLGTPRNPEYSGSVAISDLRFTFGPNNIPYILDGVFEASGNKLIITNLTATNPTSEPKQSTARFTGSMTIKNFRVDTFDFTAYGQLLLMTEATRRTIPTFYGTLFTETDAGGVNLRGTLAEPYLSGKLYVVVADLLFPPTKPSQGGSAGQTLNYVAVNDTLRTIVPPDGFSSKFYLGFDSSTTHATAVRHADDVSFIDRLRYHLDIETRGTTAIRMIFTPATNEELYAEMEGKVTAINSTGTPTIYNEISVTSRSYYNFFKRFDATGKLTFVGPWDNPELNINATYEGYRQNIASRPGEQQPGLEEVPSAGEQKVEQKVIVELKITGPRYEPKLEMGMKVQIEPGKDPVDWATQAKGGDIQSDAISFILTGKFREDLTSSERENLATNFGSAGVSGITSNLLSGIFTEFLRKEFPFIRNAEISYPGGNVSESANLRLSGEAFRGYFRVGGRILNDLGNASVSYQTSLGDFLNVKSIRNLFIELERRVEGDFSEDRRLTNNARLYYRFSF